MRYEIVLPLLSLFPPSPPPVSLSLSLSHTYTDTDTHTNTHTNTHTHTHTRSYQPISRRARKQSPSRNRHLANALCSNVPFIFYRMCSLSILLTQSPPHEGSPCASLPRHPRPACPHRFHSSLHRATQQQYLHPPRPAACGRGEC